MSKKEPPKPKIIDGDRGEFKRGYNPPRYEEVRPKSPPQSPPKKEKSDKS